jgi:tRNA 2-(methylsulfanyl)-N6-isopentenyladenosine37 hydroxylase
MSSLALASRTPASWAPSVAGNLPALLSDHAHCELKAAASAMTLLRRHGTRPGLVTRLTPLVREELEHFQLVLRELAVRGEALRPDRPSPYTRGLLAAAGEPRRRADGYVGALLVAALIEMRSHERFARLLECPALAALHALFEPLAAAEERHGDVFLQLALQAAPEGLVRERFAQLAAAEARVIAGAPAGPRMHSGPPGPV